MRYFCISFSINMLVMLVMMLQAWHTCIWGVSPILSLQIFSSSVRLDGERHYTAIFRSLQRCSIMFKSGLWWPLKDIQRLVPKPLLYCLGCVLRVVVLLEGEPSPQSEVLSTGAGFHQGSLCTLLRSSLPQSWLVSQSLLLKNIPTTWCCYHHASP